MKSKNKLFLIIALVTLLFLTLLIGTLVVIKFVNVNGDNFGSEAAVGAFSLLVTFLGTFFVAFELKNTSEVTCCEMLINLNNYFHDSDRLMRVYAALDNAYLWGKNDEEVWQGVEDEDVQFFCTFFENLALLVQHQIAKIKDLDDLFGYRFFLFMNNPHVQEKYLLTTSASFANLFNLYALWVDYRDRQNKKRYPRPLVGEKYRFTKEYLDSKMYLVDNGVGKELYRTIVAKGKTLQIRDAWFDELREIRKLQKLVYQGISDPTIYVNTTRPEFIEALHMDYVLGAYDGDRLVGVATFVDNRKTDRNLGAKMGFGWEKCFTFDAVFVHPDYRGCGLQSEFIKVAIEKAKIDGASSIWCTVSPNNPHSYKNFTEKGFKTHKCGVPMYNGYIRDVLKLDIENE